MTPSTIPSDVTAVEVAAAEGSYVDWPAILAGAVIASAIGLVMLTFGSALGLSLADFDEGDGISIGWFAIIAALWLVWVQASAFFAGAYVTGRLRRRKLDATEAESDARDGTHGVIVWATGVFFSGLVALAGLGGATAMTTGAISTIVSGAASNPDADNAAGRLYDLSIDRFLRNPTADGPADPELRSEVSRLVTAAAVSGDLAQPDRQYLVQRIAATTGVDQAAATQRVDALWTDVQRAKAEAATTADNARKVALLAAFLTAASLFVAGAAAYFAATLGGKHRDEGTELVGWSRSW